MSYTALARTWRPRRFAEMVGQEHVLRALANALDGNRVHHAFLFTGTRGVGKTTVARILAKCLNCERGVSSQPCGVCDSCREIDEGRFVDLIEVDAASRTKVDDTRELLENVQYAPTRGRYKVYLIDEVHMLSMHSFNALLKTLEEPPPHVKFLLATTDPQKLPLTVLSRCLQFNLKRLPVELIAERMRQILDAEKIDHDQAGVRLVAQAADGSMRDGLSLLDQLIAFGGGRVSEANARAMLGTVDRAHVKRIAELLAKGHAGELLQFARDLAQWAPEYGPMLDDLAALLARVAIKQVVSDFEGDELHAAQMLAEFAATMQPEDLQLWYQIAITGRRDLELSPDPATGFEMTLLRMLAFTPRGARSLSQPAVSAPAGGRSDKVANPQAIAAPAAGTAALTPDNWSGVVPQLEISGITRQLAAHCALRGRTGTTLQFALDPRDQHLRTKAQEEKLAQALSRYCGESVQVEIALATPQVETLAAAHDRQVASAAETARQSLETDATVKSLKDNFGATLQVETIRPLRNQ